MASSRKRIAVLAVAAAAAAALVAAGVIMMSGPADTAGDTGGETATAAPSAVPQRCAIRLQPAPPRLEPATDPPPPASTAAVAVTVSRSRLGQIISRQVPVSIAAGSRQPAGAAGEVTYSVTRGGFDFSVVEDRLVVSTPLSVSVSVCKPLGPFCPTYGSCNARLRATVSVPLVVGEGLEIGGSQVGVNVESPCVIAGLDASDKLMSLAQQQTGGVRRRIDKALGELADQLQRGLEAATEPLAIPGAGCAVVQPQQLLQAHPELDAQQLSTTVAVRGLVELRSSCPPASEQRAGERPALRVSVGGEVPRKSSVSAHLVIPYEQLSAELTRSLKTSGGEPAAARLSIERVKAGGAVRGGQPVLALQLTVAGPACGDVWLAAAPVWDKTAAKLKLTEAVLLPQQEPAGRYLGSLKEQLQPQGGLVALPALAKLREALQRLPAERAALERPDGGSGGVSLEISDQAERVRLRPAAAGLLVIPQVELTLRAAVN